MRTTQIIGVILSLFTLYGCSTTRNIQQDNLISIQDNLNSIVGIEIKAAKAKPDPTKAIIENYKSYLDQGEKSRIDFANIVSPFRDKSIGKNKRSLYSGLALTTIGTLGTVLTATFNTEDDLKYIGFSTSIITLGIGVYQAVIGYDQDTDNFVKDSYVALAYWDNADKELKIDHNTKEIDKPKLAEDAYKRTREAYIRYRNSLNDIKNKYESKISINITLPPIYLGQWQ